MRDNLERDVPAFHGRQSFISDFSQLIGKTWYGLQGALELVAYRLENGVGIVVLLQGDERGRHLQQTYIETANVVEEEMDRADLPLEQEKYAD